MNNDKIENLKTIIETRLKELLQRNFDKEIDCDGDESDEVQGTFLLNMVYDRSDRSNDEISLLYEALQKIKNKEFGMCEDCGDNIEYKRLIACPGAKYCIKCAEMIERQNKSFKK